MSIVENRKAFHDYFIEERFEAGLALEGWEVKAIRAGRANLKEAYVVVKNGEIVLLGAHISPLSTASTHVRADPTRTRKLLMHREEINRLVGQVERAGYTLVADQPALQERPRSSSRSGWPRARSSTTSAQRSRSANGTASSSGCCARAQAPAGVTGTGVDGLRRDASIDRRDCRMTNVDGGALLASDPPPFERGLDRNAANFVPLTPVDFLERSALDLSAQGRGASRPARLHVCASSMRAAAVWRPRSRAAASAAATRWRSWRPTSRRCSRRTMPCPRWAQC